MPRIYKGKDWEIQYRKEVRSIRKGLTASKNGRATIKNTQLILRDPNISGLNNPIICCTKNLPWTKKHKNRNLEIIRKAINLMDESLNLKLKTAIDLAANRYDLHILNKTYSQLNKTMQLNETQTKAIKALAKADARPVNQMLTMVLQTGFEHMFSEWSENPAPYFGWPEEWQSIQKNLDAEFKKVMEVN
tara:strand:+ start:239 stop:808 length:570 start_codon:yes stop_codon:yes gene_type:complete